MDAELWFLIERDMNKRNIITCIALAAITLSSCKHDLEHNMVPDKLGFSYKSQLQQPSVFNNSMDVAVIKSGKGNSSATAKIELLTEEEFTKWCLHNGAFVEKTDDITGEISKSPAFKLAPTSSYELSEKELNFSASDIRKLLKVNWNTEFFATSAINGAEYAIGLKIVDSSIGLGDNRDTLIIHPGFTRVSFRDKILKSLFPTLKDAESVNQYEGEVNINKAIPSQDVVLELGINNNLIAREAEISGKKYKPAPQGLFDIVSNTVTIKAGETISHFDYKIDLTVLFNNEGKFLETNVNYMIPIVFSKKTPELIGDGKAPVCYVIVAVVDEDNVTPPEGPVSVIHGPWEVLEGKDLHIGGDPACPSPGWYSNYNTTKLVDWNFEFGNNTDASKNGYWGSYFWSPVEFPMVFVFDTGSTYIFNRFYKVDSNIYQGQFRNFEVYVAKEYAGAETFWKLACKGKTGFKGWQNYNLTKEDGVQNIDKVLEMFSYPIPENKTAEGSEVNYTRGRYVKLCITASSKIDNKDCGYIMEFYADGWEI